MKRPYGAPDISAARAADRLAELRAEQSNAQSFRKTAAHRRASLTVVVLAVAVGGWVGVGSGLGIAALIVGATGTVLTGAVLGLGRRAVVVGQRSDASRSRAIAEEERRVHAATSYAARRRSAPSEVADFSDNAASDVRASSSDLAQVARDEWTPKPVPAPTYAMKATATRKAPGELGRPEATSGSMGKPGHDVAPRPIPATTIVSAAAAEAEPGRDRPADTEGTDGVTTHSSLRVGEPSSKAFTKAQVVAQQAAAKAAKEAARRVGPASTVRSNLDLDAILAKRRASGE